MVLTELNRLFVVEHGNKLDLNKMEKCAFDDDAVLFIGRSGERNGLSAFVKKRPEAVPYQRGLITVALGGSALSSFVQSHPFYTAQNVDVLTPQTDMPLDMKLYYCLCIEANRFRYSTFGREANRTLKKLLVPTVESVPDWVHGTTERTIKDLHLQLDVLSTTKNGEGEGNETQTRTQTQKR